MTSTCHITRVPARTPRPRAGGVRHGAARPGAPVSGSNPRFYDDDPLGVEPETQNASAVKDRDIDLVSDVLLNLFTKPGDPTPDVRARDVNTIDEVPDSSWFTNRIYAQPFRWRSRARREHDRRARPPVRGPSSGRRPRASRRGSRSPMPTTRCGLSRSIRGASPCRHWSDCRREQDVLGSRLSPGRVVSGRAAPRQLTIAAGRVKTECGRTTSGRCTMADIDDGVEARGSERRRHVPRAGRAQAPRPLVGGFRYHGTRPDDPNDIVPHEHRRSLRALKVFGAWTNLVDMKAGNTLDSVITESGRSACGTTCRMSDPPSAPAPRGRTSTRGMGVPLRGRARVEAVRAASASICSHGRRRRYDERPEMGRFEGDAFDPEQWDPECPLPPCCARETTTPSGRRCG